MLSSALGTALLTYQTAKVSWWPWLWLTPQASPLPTTAGWPAALIRQACVLPVFFSAGTWEGYGRESGTGGPNRWCLWPCLAPR